jgi:hypothetical protein
MVKIRSFSILVFIWFLASSFVGITEDITAAFKSGNAFEISAFFPEQVDITVLEESDLLSKLEAEKMIYDFFYAHPPTKFEILHQGKSKTGQEYTIGNLTTKNGTFRVSIYINKTAKSEYIQQLIIDTE